MSDAARTPPRWALALGERLIDGRVRDALLGDLIESFAAVRVSEMGLARARRWFWGQVLIAAVRFPVRPRLPLPEDTFVMGFLDDLAGAVRTLRRAPAFLLLCAATLAHNAIRTRGP